MVYSSPLLRTIAAGVGVVIALTSCALAVKHENSDELPANLTAQQYLEMGIRYQKMGRVELSRQALTQAQKKDPQGDIGTDAAVWLRVKVPPHEISQEAEQRNVIGVNQRLHGDNNAARKTLTDVIHDYPDFEWPYGNLALVCLSENKPEEAASVLKKALDINPNYANGWDYLGRTKQTLGDEKSARECFQKSRQLLGEAH